MAKRRPKRPAWNDPLEPLRKPLETPFSQIVKEVQAEIQAYIDEGIESVDKKWAKTHVLREPPDKKEFHVRGSSPTMERAMTKIVGSGIEHGQYIWYDYEDDLWYYGVDDDDLSP